MAKTSIAEKLITAENQPGIEPIKLEGSRPSKFREVLLGSMFKSMSISALGLLFFLPAIIWMVYVYIIEMVMNVSINYSGNIGIGINIVPDADRIGAMSRFELAMGREFLILVPLIIVGFIGLAGSFYAMRLYLQGDKKVFRNFFKGVGKHFADFLLPGLACGLAVYFFGFNYYMYDAMGHHVAFKVLGLILASLILLAIAAYTMYIGTMKICYKMGPKALMKNSSLFIIRLPLQTILFTLLGLIPVVLLIVCLPYAFSSSLSGGSLSVIISFMGVMIVLMFGIAFTAAAWSLYGDYIYDMAFEAAKKIKKEKKKLKKQAAT